MTALASIKELVGRYHLQYYFNPGGAEFFRDDCVGLRHCQIPACDDEEDYQILKAWCEKNHEVLSQPIPPGIYYDEGSITVVRRGMV